MFYGMLIFAVLAIVLVFAFLQVRKRDREYGAGE
jgi:hypothetical protein